MKIIPGKALPCFATKRRLNKGGMILPALALLLLAVAPACSGGGQATQSAPPAPDIASFSAATNPITAGGNTTLNWTATNAVSFSINGTAVTGTSLTVSPASTTSYTLSAANSAGMTATAKVTVHVLPGISNFTSSAPSVSVGGSGTTLSWTVLDATSLSLAATPMGGSTTTTDVTGTSNFAVNPAVATNYVLTASNSEGNTPSPTLQITTTPALTDIASFLTYQTSTAGPIAVASTSAGSTVYLIPVFANGDTATITDASGSSQCSSVASGTACAVAPTVSTTYTLTVTNPSTSPAGTEIRKLRVIVGDVTDFSGVGQVSGNFTTTTFSDTGSASTVQYQYPVGITTDEEGSVYIYDYYACIVDKLDSSGNPTRVAGSLAGSPAGTSCATYNTAPVDGEALPQTSTGGATFTSGSYSFPAASASGVIYLADSLGGLIRQISGGTVSTFAGSYANNGSDQDGTGTNAYFASGGITGVAVDSLDEMVVSEYTGLVRSIDSNAKVTTLAGVANAFVVVDGTGLTGGGAGTAEFYLPNGIAIDTTTDTIYIADGNAIRVMSPDKSVADASCPGVANPGAACWKWTVTTWMNQSETAGDIDGAASSAQFNYITGLARSSDGTLFVSDNSNYYIRRITPDGTVDTIVGNGTCTNSSVGCTLPNAGSGTESGPEPLPGVVYPWVIAVDPTQNRLFFLVNDVDSVFAVPY